MLYGEELVNTLRQMSEGAQRRLWVYTPFLGSWASVKRILGDDWRLKWAVQVRLLTDIRNKGWIDPETYTEFKKRGEVATLPGLHAKIYVADDHVMITSANLTQTAFQKRYEAGIVRKCTAADELYLAYLWNSSRTIPSSWKPRKHKWTGDRDEQGSGGLGAKWNLPDSPRRTGDASYDNRLAAFADFRGLYLKYVKRVWPRSPVYFEIDSFLNYLFHEHPNTPAQVYRYGGRARVSHATRVARLKRYHALYRSWVDTTDADDHGHREEYHRKLRRILGPSKIQTATWKDIEGALSHVWALQGNPLNKAKFFNRGTETNNRLPDVRNAFRVLFDDSQGPMSSRFRYCREQLVGFGPGAVGELIGYYYPDQFPIANNNSLSGLRFFGYAV